MEVERRGKEERDGERVGGGKTLEVILRVLGFVMCLVAAIVVGVDKETKVVPVTVSFNLPPLEFTATAKWHYLSALVYLLAANVIACSYGFVSLFFLFINDNKNNILALSAVVLDTVVVALLFSSSGAAAAVGVIAYHGNSHVQWGQVCDIYGRFCKQVTAATVLSLGGAVVFMSLVVLASVGLQKRSV